MQIQFDPRDPTACVGVIAAIIGLHGEIPMASGEGVLPNRPDVPAMPSAPAAPNPPQADPPAVDSGDAAAAFDTPPAAPAPAVPVSAPGDDADDEPAATIPVSAPGDDADDDAGNPAPPVSPAENSAGATTPTPAPAGSPPAGVEVDADGLPWDERIHSGPKKDKPKNQDGTWRRKRGLAGDDKADYVKSVEAELRQIMGAGNAPAAPQSAAPSTPPAPAVPAPTAAPAAPAPTVADAGTASGPVVAETAASPAPAAPPAAPPVAPAAPPPPAPPAVDDTPTTFPALMKRITAMQTAGQISVADTNAIAVSLGLTGVKDVLHRPDLVPAFVDGLGAFGGAA